MVQHLKLTKYTDDHHVVKEPWKDETFEVDSTTSTVYLQLLASINLSPKPWSASHGSTVVDGCGNSQSYSTWYPPPGMGVFHGIHTPQLFGLGGEI